MPDHWEYRPFTRKECTLLSEAASMLRDSFTEIVPEEEQVAWDACPIEVICGVADWLSHLGGPLASVTIAEEPGD